VLVSLHPIVNAYNVYKGVIDLDLELLVFTGFNSQGQELVVIGRPDNEGHRIECESWCRNRGTNQIAFMDRFVLARQ